MVKAVLYGVVLAWLAAASALGILMPGRRSLSSGANIELLAGMSAGVLLSVALLHLLDDAQERLSDLTDYPAANACALFGFLTMAAAQAFMPCLHGQSNREPLLPLDEGQLDDGQARVRFYALEASISLHSVLIGMSIGFSESEWTEMLVLAIALTVHQFFEGFALGMLARRTLLSSLAWTVTCLLFTLSLPLGGVAAIAAEYTFASFTSSATYFWVSGLLNAFAAGMLMQIGVEMVNHELTGSHALVCSDVSPHKRPQQQHPCLWVPEKRPDSLARLGLKVLSVFAGALLFGVLAIWA